MKRRELLRKTGAGIAATTAVAGVAGARTDVEPLSRREAPVAAMNVLADSDGLLDDLAADGLLDRSDLQAADLSRDTVSLGDTETWMVGFSRSVDDGTLSVHVLPEFGKAYATLEGADGTFEAYGDGVSADACSGCYYEICYCVDECGDYCCDHECTCVLKCYCGGPCEE